VDIRLGTGGVAYPRWRDRLYPGALAGDTLDHTSPEAS
jgi:hypothetical protein